MLYLVNTPVLTAYGEYRFDGPLSLDAARTLASSGFQSAVGHDGAAALLGQLLGMEVPLNRTTITMQAGDQALVLRVKQRLPEGVVLSAEELAAMPFELALLSRIA